MKLLPVFEEVNRFEEVVSCQPSVVSRNPSVSKSVESYRLRAHEASSSRCRLVPARKLDSPFTLTTSNRQLVTSS
jgi:hypothetical protein